MRVIYISNLCSKTLFEKIKSFSRVCPSLCVQKYHSVMVKGLCDNGCAVEVVSAMPISRATSKKLFFVKKKEKEQSATFRYLPVINIPIVKQVLQSVFCFFVCCGLCFKDRETVFLCDALCGSSVRGAKLAAKLFRREVTGIITDIPQFFSEEKVGLSDRMLMRSMQSFDSYVFLTEAMNPLINRRHRPYVTIEGQADYDTIDVALVQKKKTRICMYAGAIEKIYGLEMLVKGFVAADLPNTELHIFGTGTYIDEVREICKTHANVFYLGVKPNDEIVAAEAEATLLINPRPSAPEYTKYSFPSKTMEYMASGTPVLTTRLPGIPQEYYEHLFFIEEESVSGVCDALRKTLSFSEEELKVFGRNAQQWVKKYKNCRTQAQKILKMWSNDQ